ncbi:hypothetical protein CMO93_04595 [Candidatus Woesearchaeota archaeon]|nr:hypothetical protein [Candidatus Woesearchaeota archaeon]
MIKIKLDLEKILLILFFAIFLFLGPGTLFDHKIKHDFPFGYSASDAFQHQVRAEAIKDAGNFKYEAAYISKGIENVEGRYPPVIYHLSVILSYTAGIEVYDSIYFIVSFFGVIAALIVYLIIRNLNKTVAMLSLPLSLLIFSFPVSIGYLWGHWPSIFSQSFLILFFWSIMRMNMKQGYILVALSLSATALTHTSETIFAFVFLALFLVIKLIMKKLSKDDIKNMVLSFIIFFIISFYYLVIFMNTWAKQSYKFMVQPIWEGNPGFYIAGFGLLLIPIILGLVFALPKLKNAHVSLILGYAMLIGGFLNYAGFEVRSFQIRFFWPIYLAIFFGFGTYALFKLIIKKWNFIYTSIIFVVFIILLSGTIELPILKQTDIQNIPSIPQINRASSQGMMDPFHWQALEWLSENTEQNSRIYFFYGDIYSQDALLRNSKRVHNQVDPEDFIKAIQDKKIKRFYISELPGDTGGTISKRTGIFSFEGVSQSIPHEDHFGPQDICKFNYLIFDKASRQEVLAQYNLLIASDLIKNEYINPVFENEVIVILKNEDIEADCIEERSF